MKKFYYTLFVSALLTPSVLSAYDGKTWDKTWQNGTLQEATEEKAKDWMADLPDNMFVAHVSIPGTHDSATGGEWSSLFGDGASTQDALIDEMMNRGIRAWDFRPGLSGNTVYCAHNTFLLKLTLRDAMKQLTDFLDEHNGEFFVIHLYKGNVDNGASNSSTLNTLLGQIFNEGEIANYIVPFRPDLKVRDARGKIILLRRDAMSYAELPNAGYIDGWHKGFENGNGLTVYNASDRTLSTQLVVQDWSDAGDDIETKKTDCEALLNWCSTQTTPDDGFKTIGSFKPKWTMNFTSRGNVSLNYQSSARTMNPFVNTWFDSHLGEGPVGIIMSDWVLRDAYSSCDLVYNIIHNNFAGTNPPVVKYAVDETLADTPTVYLRNVATGLYISAGGEWDTRATLYTDGIQVKITKNDNGTVNLATTFRQQGGWIGVDPYVDQDRREWTMKQVGKYYTFTSYKDDSQIALGATDYTVEYWDGNKAVEYTTNVDENDPNQQWEILTLADIIEEAAAGAESGKEYDLTMIMPEAHSFREDTHIDDWGNIGFETQGSFHQTWAPWVGNGIGIRFLCRFSNNEGDYNKAAYTWTRNYSGLPNGRYRFRGKLATRNFDPKTADGFSFTINGTEAKDLIYNATSEPGIEFNGGTQEGAGNEFGQALFNVYADKVTMSFEFTVTNGTIDMIITKGNAQRNTSETLYLDDFQFVYLGKDKTDIEVSLPMYYNTLMLPFDVEELPENLVVYKAEALEEKINTKLPFEDEDYKYHVITLSSPLDKIEANTPYIIINTNGTLLSKDNDIASGISTLADDVASDTFTFSGYPHSIDQNEYVSGILTGVHEETYVAEGNLVLTQTESFQKFAKVEEETLIQAHTAYINIENTPEATLANIMFTEQPGLTTGVENVGTDANDAPVKYYNMQGIRVMNPSRGNIYIRRQGSTVEKVIL